MPCRLSSGAPHAFDVNCCSKFRLEIGKAELNSSETLRYPGREMLYPWEKSGDGKKLRDHLDRCPQRMCQISILSIEEEKNAVKRCFERGESVKLVSKELGCSSTSLSLWRDRYIRGATVSPM